MRGKLRRCSQTTNQRMAAPDPTRSVVNVAASTSRGAKAKRQSSELAAKQSIAAAVSTRVGKGIPPFGAGTGPWLMMVRQILVGAAPREWMCSAIRAASSPTPDKKEELIFDSQGRPKK